MGISATADTGAHLDRERERGHPTEYVGFRCPKELVEAAKEVSPNISKAATVLMDRASDAKEEMGKDWIELVVYAHREGIYIGQALGRLAKKALDAERKKR